MLNNEDLNQVTWEQRVMEGDPRFDASQRIPYVPFHEYARLIGLRQHQGRPRLADRGRHDQAFAADRPFVIDAMTDPEEPPLPPHITFKQARGLHHVGARGPSDGLAGRAQRHPREGRRVRPGPLT